MRCRTVVVPLIVLASLASLEACTNLDNLAGGGDRDGGADAAADSAPQGDAGASCTTTESDPKNCGSCGHDCLGGACSAGKCQPFTVISRDGGAFYGLSLHPQWIFYTDNKGYNVDTSTIERANRDGSDQQVLVTMGAAPMGIVNDDSSVYWVTQQNGELHGRSLDGTQPRSLPNNQFNASSCISISRDGKTLYFGHGGEVRRYTFGGSVTSLLGGQLGPVGVLADDTALFWTTSNGNVMTANLGGASIATITEGEQGPGCLAKDGDDLYWPNSGSGKIVSRNLKTSTSRTIAADEGAPKSVAVDAVSVWWTNGSSIRRVAK